MSPDFFVTYLPDRSERHAERVRELVGRQEQRVLGIERVLANVAKVEHVLPHPQQRAEIRLRSSERHPEAAESGCINQTTHDVLPRPTAFDLDCHETASVAVPAEHGVQVRHAVRCAECPEVLYEVRMQSRQ